MSEAEKWNVGLQVLSLFVALVTLRVTYYFTKQLVDNDNHRRMDADNERLKFLFKESMINMDTDTPGVVQSIGAYLVRNYPKNKKLIFEAYSELRLVKGNMKSLDEFRKLLRDYGENVDD